MIFFKKLHKRHKHIAIFAPNNNIVFSKVVDGALATLRESDDLLFEFSIIHSDDDLAQLVDKISMHLDYISFDALITFGKFATKATKLLTETKRLNTPIVFGGVLNPVGNGFIQSYGYPGNHLTGVAAVARDYKGQLASLVRIFNSESRKQIERVLILHSPEIAPDIKQSHLEVLRENLARSNVSMVSVPFTDPTTILESLVQLTASKTIVMTLRDNAATSNISAIVDICNQLKLPLFTSDLETTKLGAAIGIGGQESDTGERVGSIALELLINQVHPKFIPVPKVHWNLRYKINQAAVQRQGLKLDDQTVSSLREVDCSFV